MTWLLTSGRLFVVEGEGRSNKTLERPDRHGLQAEMLDGGLAVEAHAKSDLVTGYGRGGCTSSRCIHTDVGSFEVKGGRERDTLVKVTVLPLTVPE